MRLTCGRSSGPRWTRSWRFPKSVASIIDTCGGQHSPASPEPPPDQLATVGLYPFHRLRSVPLTFASLRGGADEADGLARIRYLPQRPTPERVGRTSGEGQGHRVVGRLRTAAAGDAQSADEQSTALVARHRLLALLFLQGRPFLRRHEGAARQDNGEDQ
jgi:hypothetical protein